MHGRSSEKAEELIRELDGLNSLQNEFVICDLNEVGKVNQVFGKVKQLDILVNNAGVWLEGDTIDASPEKILELVNVNLASYLLVFRAVLPVLLESEFAQVLNVVSKAGYEVPEGDFYSVYSATKYGLQGFTEATVKEFYNKNLRVMGFYPGGMETKIFKKAGNEYNEKEPWMFDPQESVDAMMFMLTRNPKVNVKRMDIVNHLAR